MDTGIGEVVKGGNGNAIIFTALLAAIVANVMPVPTDYLYFQAQQSDKEKLESGCITAKQYWTRDILGYYGYTASWYLFLFLILYSANGSYKNNSRILLALLSAGLIVSVYNKNITKDEQIQDLRNQQQEALAKKLGVSKCALSICTTQKVNTPTCTPILCKTSACQ